jgi:uncharacterized SAM-binding protein YcdF (DUF218 family)
MARNPLPNKKYHALKKVVIWVIPLLLGCLLIVSLGVPILTGVANYLVRVDTPLHKADMIFLLNGDYNTRPFYASDLYRKGLVPVIVIARSESKPAELLGLVENPTDIAVEVLKKRGVPPDSVIVLNETEPVTSTFDEMRSLRGYIQANQIRSVILVTSTYHTRRARWILEKELTGLPVTLEVAGAPNTGFDSSNWWQQEDGLITVNNEYIKLFFYWFKYR